MLTLSNGAKVHTIYIVPGGNGLKPHGICLAETETDWVVWNIYWNGVISNPATRGGGFEVWEAESGDYFAKNDSSRGQLAAEFQFGRRLYRLMLENMWKGALSAD